MMKIIEFFRKIFKRNIKIYVQTKELAYYNSGRPVMDKNGLQLTKTELEVTLDNKMKVWSVSKKDLEKYMYKMDLYSENNYGKETSHSILDWDEINKTFHKHALKLIEKCEKNPGVYYWIKNNRIEYIGKSINVRKRTAEHLINGNNLQAFDRYMRKEVDNYSIKVKYMDKELLDNFEREEIEKYNPKYNFKQGGTKIAMSSKKRDLEITQGILINKINIEGKVFSITGQFKDKYNKLISRSKIIRILEELGGIYKGKAKSSTVWLVGENPGMDKMSVIDEDDYQLDSPLKIAGFQEKYYK